MPEIAPPLRRFVHDGSFCGFLCAAAEAINGKRERGETCLVLAPDELDLFSEATEVPADGARAEALFRRIALKAGEESLQRILEAFCSDHPGISASSATMISKLWVEGPSALADFADADALAVEKAAHRARAEAHAYLGLIRFSELADGSWYAPVEPDCDILPLIADHFAARFPDMRFAIHDAKRKSAILHRENGGWSIESDFALEMGGTGSDLANKGGLLSERESLVRQSWSIYFDSVAIQERRNDKLQAGHMPKRYWKHLPEKRFGQA